MRNRCEICLTKADCVAAFGIYWIEKSHGGVGCDYRFEYRRRDAPTQSAIAAQLSWSTARKNGKVKRERAGKWR